MLENHTISLYQHGRNGERSFLIWRSISDHPWPGDMPLPTLRPDCRYRLTVHNGPRLVYSCSPESAEFVLGRLHELLEQTPDPVVPALEALGESLGGQLAKQERAAAYAQLVDLVGQDEADRLLAGAEPEPRRWAFTWPLPERTAALTRDELRTIDDGVEQTIDGWTDYQCAGAYLLITRARRIDFDRAWKIRRQEEAKVQKNGK